MTTRHANALRLRAIDRAFARFVVRRLRPAAAAARVTAPLPLLGQAERHEWALLYHTALLVSALQGEGHSCVDLAAYAGTALQESDDVDAFTFPDVATWCAALRVSGAVDEPLTAHAPSIGIDADALELPPFVLDGEHLYLLRYYLAECRVATAIRARASAAQVPAVDVISTALFRTLFPNAATQVDAQALAATVAVASPLACITGGPGTGKTTVVARVLALLLANDASLRIALAAPTGRAAARLVESVQRESHAVPEHLRARLPQTGVTLHRLLGYRPYTDRFARNADDPLPFDVVVVDEASMVDVLMMDAVLAALAPDSRLVLLGDPGQLASVDTGFVLGDIVRAVRDEQHGPSPLRDAVVALMHSYRFAAQRGIGALAAASRAGDIDAARAVLDDHTQADVALHAPTHDAEQLLAPLNAAIGALLAAHTPADALHALARFRILAAVRDGDAGIGQLNALVEQWLRARGHDTRGWYAHRPVLITANDPATQLFNGDVGVVYPVDGVPMVHFAAGTQARSLAPARLPAHETAWAMTVHKAQGSEFDRVLLVLPAAESRILTRELVYTGVTRARQHVTIVGTIERLASALSRGVARTSGLPERLAGRA